jgi:RNA polymerase M subunit
MLLSKHILLKLKQRLTFKEINVSNPIGEQGDPEMRVEKQIGLHEWLLGSTILCQSCGCLWLVPAAQEGDNYSCRQCGSEVSAKTTSTSSEKGVTQGKTNH